MSLLSTLAAHDLGYLATDRLLERLDAMLRAVESLERFQGHLSTGTTPSRGPRSILVTSPRWTAAISRLRS